MGGGQAVGAPGSGLGLPITSERLSVQLGVDLTPSCEVKFGGLPPECHIIGHACLKAELSLAGCNQVEVTHEISLSHGLAGCQLVGINAKAPDPFLEGADGPLLPGLPGHL